MRSAICTFHLGFSLGGFSSVPFRFGRSNRSLQLHRQVRGPAPAGRGRQREDSDPQPGAAGPFQWPGTSGSPGLLRPGRAVPDDGRSGRSLQHLLDQVRSGAGHSIESVLRGTHYTPYSARCLGSVVMAWGCRGMVGEGSQEKCSGIPTWCCPL